MKVGRRDAGGRHRAHRSGPLVLDPHHLIMVDANQAFSVNEALRRGQVYQELGCYWFEEPIRADDTERPGRALPPR